MYPFDFEPDRTSINPNEIFVVMPFADSFRYLYDELIIPAINLVRDRSEFDLRGFRSDDDPTTDDGWRRILEHLFTAQIVIGVLTSNNANVFYELGIAHATQSKSRQILMASKYHKTKFDIQGLTYFEYADRDNIEEDIERLASTIEATLRKYDSSEDKLVYQTKAKLGLSGFSAMLHFKNQDNFSMRITNEERLRFDEESGPGTFDRLIQGIDSLSESGLARLKTETRNDDIIEFSFWWTEAGIAVLEQMGLITEEEKIRKKETVRQVFRMNPI